MFFKSNFTIKEAVDELEESGYRCIPVLDETTSFKGNVYVQDVYRAIVKEAVTWEDSIMDLISDEDVYIQEKASFFRVFSNIKKYPYLAVLDEDDHFTGILTHANVMEILEDSWGIKSGSYTLTVSTHEYQGTLNTILSNIKKFPDIHSLMTLDISKKIMDQYDVLFCIILR